MRPHAVLITLGIAIIAFVGGFELSTRFTQEEHAPFVRVPHALPAIPVAQEELFPDGPAPRGAVLQAMELVAAQDAAEPAPAPAPALAPAPVAEPAPEAPVARPVQPFATLTATPPPRDTVDAPAVPAPVPPTAPTPSRRRSRG